MYPPVESQSSTELVDDIASPSFSVEPFSVVKEFCCKPLCAQLRGIVGDADHLHLERELPSGGQKAD